MHGKLINLALETRSCCLSDTQVPSQGTSCKIFLVDNSTRMSFHAEQLIQTGEIEEKNWPLAIFILFIKPPSYMLPHVDRKSRMLTSSGKWQFTKDGSSKVGLTIFFLVRIIWDSCRTKGQIFLQEWHEWQYEFFAGPEAMFGEQVLKRSRGEGMLLSSFLPIISSTFPQS